MKRLVKTILLTLLVGVLAACGGGTSAHTTGSSVPEGQIIVRIGDFYVHAAQTTFVANTRYHFVVTNEGTHHHDFLIMHPMSTATTVMDEVYQRALAFLYNLAPGESKTLDLTFTHTAPDGMLEFSCHYGGHWEAGMHQAIEVVSPQGAAVSSYPNNGLPTQQNMGISGSRASNKCDRTVSVALGANNTYDRRSVSLKAGDTLTIVNMTKQTFTLLSEPAAGLRFTAIDPGETEHVLFPHAGTFTLSSQEHPTATLSVKVATTAGATCGYTAAATVSFDADYTHPKNSYFFTPAHISIREGQSITLSNLADANLTFASKPSTNLGNITLDRNEHQPLLFQQSGTYTITCVQFPQEHMTVVVQKNNT